MDFLRYFDRSARDSVARRFTWPVRKGITDPTTTMTMVMDNINAEKHPDQKVLLLRAMMTYHPDEAKSYAEYIISSNLAGRNKRKRIVR